MAAEFYLALVLWPLGEVEHASALVESGLEHAAASGHPPTIAYGHAYLCIFEAMRGHPELAARNAEALVDLGLQRG